MIELDDKNANRIWKQTTRMKYRFFCKYHVSEQFIESNIDLIDEYFWDAVSRYQKLSLDFIIKHIDKIHMISLGQNKWIEKGIIDKHNLYVLKKLSVS
jgi:hypothetical protein